ncbi:hypothetical protein RJ55_04677 [Drechmeria coniospora]|nr:hypothetical protein RJ55_04677 [Drechmeria coniospora]
MSAARRRVRWVAEDANKQHDDSGPSRARCRHGSRRNERRIRIMTAAKPHHACRLPHAGTVTAMGASAEAYDGRSGSHAGMHAMHDAATPAA